MRTVGAPDRDIEATSLEIGTQHTYNETTRREEFAGIRVARRLTARFDSTDKLSRFLAGLETSQHVQVQDTATSLSTEPQLRAELRKKAIADTAAKARELAAAYGVALGALYSVSDVAPDFSYGIQEGAWPAMYRWSKHGGGDWAWTASPSQAAALIFPVWRALRPGSLPSRNGYTRCSAWVNLCPA